VSGIEICGKSISGSSPGLVLGFVQASRMVGDHQDVDLGVLVPPRGCPVNTHPLAVIKFVKMVAKVFFF